MKNENKERFDKELDRLAFYPPNGVPVDFTCKIFHRKEDMSPDGRLQVVIDSDGDSVIGMIPPTHDDSFGPPSMEFCTPMMGGGKSRRVHRAIRVLAWAIALDNLESGFDAFGNKK